MISGKFLPIFTVLSITKTYLPEKNYPNNLAIRKVTAVSTFNILGPI
jgi:hypothetical protein